VRRRAVADSALHAVEVVTSLTEPWLAFIVPGLVEENFPKAIRQDPLLLDTERQYLAEVLGCDLSQRRRLSEAERLLFALIDRVGRRPGDQQLGHDMAHRAPRDRRQEAQPDADVVRYVRDQPRVMRAECPLSDRWCIRY
jgi:hypothetical protein